MESAPERPFALAMRIRFPPGRGKTRHAELFAFFEGRAHIDTIRQWRSGRRGPPQWAIDLLAAEFRRLADLAASQRPHDPAAMMRRNRQGFNEYRFRRMTERVAAGLPPYATPPKTGKPRGPAPRVKEDFERD